MRFLHYSLLSLATITSTYAAQTSEDNDDLDEVVPDTIFNGQTVPPLIELGPKTIEKDLSKGNWLVEFFSPQCGHCIAFRPTWQTLYEFYHTFLETERIENSRVL